MSIEFIEVVPILRMFDEAKAREFYVDFLGFKVDWEHRFEPGTPLYMQVSRGKLALHLSEHHGDGTPGTAVYVPMKGIDAFHAELSAKKYKYNRPGICDQSWGMREMTVNDPFGNTIRFGEKIRIAGSTGG
jgi:catechol 2,3-dioxygenase-like lactoylglutathione lyase family enzyme